MKRPEIIRSLALIGSATLGIGAAAPAVAQGALEEIVVTAQKREQNLQEVPIAITALDAHALEVQNVTDTDSFAKLVPNLHIKQGTTGVITIAIRGVSNNDGGNPGFENAVGIYIDGVYTGRAVGSLFDLGDVERVEVLRGPQGTLYGRNTIGGAVNFISRRPSGELATRLKVGVGNENLRYGNLNVDLPAIGTAGDGLGELRSRVSVYARKRDGFTDNVQQNFTTVSRPIANFDEFGTIDRRGGRLAFDWDIHDGLTVIYDYTKFRADEHQRLLQVIDVVPGGGRPAGFEKYIPHGQPSKGSANEPAFFDTDTDAHALQVNWDINDRLTLRSITGYRKLDSLDGQDLDGSDTSFYESIRLHVSKQWSQEFQLVGSSDQLEYVLGLYYFDEDADSNRVQQLSNAALHRITNAYMDNENKAVFGQIDYTPSWNEALTLSFGARYTKEKKNMPRYLKTYTGGTGRFAVEDPGPNLQVPELDFSNTSVMFSPSYQLTDDISVYARYAEGFRSGGYDGHASSPATALLPYDSEELESYELGIKSRWLDQRLQLNAAAFYSDYTNMQLTSYSTATGPTSVVLNAGQASLWGMEIEAEAWLSEGLRASLNLAYLDYEFDEFDMGPAIGDVSDRAKINNAPRSTANLALDYTFPPIGPGELALHLNYNYSEPAHAIAIKANGDAPNSEMSSRGLLDGRLTLRDIAVGTGGSRLELALWGMNLTDEEYYDNIIDFSSYRAGTLGWPRTFGLEVTLDL